MKQLPLKIVVSGPESTGKTDLVMHLSTIFQAAFIPEYARSYVENLDRHYTYKDVEHIARQQVKDLQEAEKRGGRMIILDTYLVITKIWFLEVYGRMPEWIDKQLREAAINLYLLCYHDLEWVEDPVRENPGQRREFLYNRYRQEIESLGIPCELIRGFGKERLENAREAVIRHFPYLSKD